MKLGFSRDAFLGVENPTSTPLEIISIVIQPAVSVPGEFIIANGPTTITLAPSEGINLLLRCIPQGPNQRTAILKIQTASEIKEVFLIGNVTSTQPDVSVKPSFIDFGKVALGDTKDTSYTIYGGGIDSIDIYDLLLENDDGGIFFEAYPKDGLFAFPEKIGPNDSLVILARFIAATPSGIVNGRSTAFGKVSGELKCEFRGEIAFPELSFSTDLIDIGVRNFGEVVDTFVYLQSNGSAPVELEEIIPPNVFTLLTNPTVPQSIAPNNTIRVDLRFTATTIGLVSDVLGALAKSTASGGKYRQVALKAIVLPNGLASRVDSVLNVECIDMGTDSLSIRVSDTGSYPITIDSIRIDNPNVLLSANSTFPLALSPFSSKTIQVVYSPDGKSRTTDSAIIEYLISGHVVIRDTVRIAYVRAILPLATASITQTPLDYTDSLSLKADTKLNSLGLFAIDYVFQFFPDDIADINIAKLNSALQSSGNITGNIVFNDQDNTYRLQLLSSVPMTDNDIASVKVPLRYYVTKQAIGDVVISTTAPGNEQCFDAFLDTLTITSPDLCGDPHIRQALNNNLTASFIGMRVLTADNNYTATYKLVTPSDVTLDWYSQLGELVTTEYFGSLSNGIHSVSVSSVGLSSGSLVGRLTTVSNGMKSVVSSVYHLIK
ncbi:MAG TPA: hypothetical protein VIX80_02570 [Candidatus Kapabacteria bacterium]